MRIRSGIRWLSDDELLFTAEGRAWLRKWCGASRLDGEAANWLERLNKAETDQPIAPYEFSPVPQTDDNHGKCTRS